MDKISLVIDRNNLNKLSAALTDLSKISDIIKFKFSGDDLFIYSIVGDSAIIGFKNYTFKISDLFKGEVESPFDYILIGSKKFVKNLSFFEGESIKILFNIKPNLDGTLLGRLLTINDGTFSVKNSGGEIHKIKDITKELLNSKFPKDESKPNFKISWETLQKIKRISSNTEEVVTKITIKDKKVIFSEGNQWTLNVGNSDCSTDLEISFDNSYLTNINQSEVIHLFIFDTVIMFDDDNSKLLVAFEQG